MPIYVVLSTVAFAVALSIIWWVHAQAAIDLSIPPHSAYSTGAAGSPFVSLLVPARNEEHNIRRCVVSLLSQDYPAFELIVVDDRSTDGTGAILDELEKRDPHLKVVQGLDLPPGWAGKPYALFQAARIAHGDWLVFVDADTWLEPGSLAATLEAALATQADLFTTLNRQVMGTFWEKAVLPLVLLGLSIAFPPRMVNDPESPVAVANGQYLMIRRAVYEAIGGHEAIKGEIVEDKAIALRVKRSACRLVVADGRHFVNTRMYRSLSEMWEGWTKNIYLGLRDQTRLLALGVFGAFLALLATLVLPLWPLLGLGWLARGGGWMAMVVVAEALIVWAYLLFQRAKASRAFEISQWYALSLPLGSAVFASMMAVSAWNVISGRGVTWKGRTYK